MAESNIINDRPKKLSGFNAASIEFDEDERLTVDAYYLYMKLIGMWRRNEVITVDLIVTRTKLKRTAAIKAIKVLKELGWLTVNTTREYNEETQSISVKSEYILHWVSDSVPLSPTRQIEAMAQEMKAEYIQVQEDFTREEINKLMANK